MEYAHSQQASIAIGNRAQEAFEQIRLEAANGTYRAMMSFIEAGDAIRDHATRPSVLYRPSIGRDGNQWCALYGENLMEGVCGFGDSPECAMADFDANWSKKIVGGL